MRFIDEFSFIEKPASKDELAVARVMRGYWEALRDHDLKLLSSLFQEDARIDSLAAGRVVSREQYIKAMSQVLQNLEKIEFKNLLIRINNENAATVYGFSRYRYRGGNNRWWQRVWQLRKTHNRWQITETNYCRS